MTLKHSFTLQPRDLLFMRDARPMEASDAGLGANWPRPDQLWNALINAFHREWPEQQEWEGSVHSAKEQDKNQNSSFRFGALRTVGPFPQRKGELYLPMPLDYGMKLVECEGTDLPKPLKHAFLPEEKGKQKFPAWISKSEYEEYLKGKLTLTEKRESAPLYFEERNIGIAIDPESGTTVEGKLYQAEYLRLAQDVSLAFAAECQLMPRGGGAMADVFEKFGFKRNIIIGGQQGVAHLNRSAEALALPPAALASQYLRWTLITPAVFNGGWLPGWLDANGKAMLRSAIRKPGESRRDWKARQENEPVVGGNLIAARIGKPLAFSGWDLQAGGAKPTQLAVPAGSCYVFKCDSVDHARALATLLQARPRSDIFGEKGFGYGLCSSLEVPES
jgi:CRISPR-associated protein Cmr3